MTASGVTAVKAVRGREPWPGELRPSSDLRLHTVADFRKDAGPEIRKVRGKFVVLCR